MPVPSHATEPNQVKKDLDPRNRIDKEKLVLDRPLERHLDNAEIDALVSAQRSESDSRDLSEQAQGEAQRHVESCEDCDRKVQMHKQVQSEISRLGSSGFEQATSGCPNDTDWLHVVAGLAAEANTKELIAHAAHCDHCGPLFRSAAESLSDESTPEEERILSSLGSAKPRWQRDLAGRLGRNARQSAVADGRRADWWKGFAVWSRRAFAAMTLAILVVIVGLRVFRAPSAQQLLANAYTEQRTLELRIPGAKFAPMHLQRGRAGSALDRSPQLLKAESLISESLNQHPDDPTWLRAKGQADLLDNNYETAIAALQKAIDLEPKSPSLWVDLASAYFERGEGQDRPEDYGMAVDLLGKALAEKPDDPVAIFNRAIVSERIFLYKQAIADWEHYLILDPHGEWTAEAQGRLDAVRQKLRSHDRGSSSPLMNPDELSSGQDRLAKRSSVDQRIEDYLQVASGNWLTTAFPDHNAGPGSQRRAFLGALKLVAEIMRTRHHDALLSDLLEASSSPAFPGAVRALSESLRASAAGDFGSALNHSETAFALFHNGRNRAGELRAMEEEVYALQLSERAKECLTVAERLARAPEVKRYSWLRIQVEVEETVCLNMQNRVGEARQLAGVAAEDAEESGYENLHLRALAFAGGMDAATGDFSSGWKVACYGLAEFWGGQHSAMRGHNLYSALDDLAEAAHQWHLQTSILQQAFDLISSTDDTLLKAMGQHRLATAAFAAGMPAQAKASFEEASHLFAASPQTEATQDNQMEAAVWLARVETMQGQLDQALARLNTLEIEGSKASSRYVVINYYQTLGEVQAQRDRIPEAESALLVAIAASERGLQSLRTENERAGWNKQTSGAYRTLVQLALRKKNPMKALEIWEWYRGAGLRGDIQQATLKTPSNLGALVDDNDPRSLDAVAKQQQYLTQETIVSYAVYPRGISVWVYDNRGVVNKWVSFRQEELDRLSRRFVELCADPNSDIAEFRHEAQHLYQLLIRPIADQLVSGRTLIIEGDGAIEGIPIQALLDEQQRYLEDRFALVFSPGLYYLDRLRPVETILPSVHALVVASDGIRQDDLRVLRDVEVEGREIARKFPASKLLEGGSATWSNISKFLPGAVVFHFAGHALSNHGQTGLVLAGDKTENSAELLSADTLSGVLVPRTQLAVLAACSSGKGEDGRILEPGSFERWFLHAGVPHVVASRWGVDSAATESLMETFYAALLSGKSVSESLREAAARVRTIPDKAHPYYWAAFSAFGRA
jgi:CHAT domain-containing protein/cytochrome c-type biogenesis protein CcmH/NrfG